MNTHRQVSQSLINAIVLACTARKDFIAEKILQRKPKVLGIYRMVMKAGLYNSCTSSIQGIMKRTKTKGIKVVICEPGLEEAEFYNSPVTKDILTFKQETDVIIANRHREDLDDVAEKFLAAICSVRIPVKY